MNLSRPPQQRQTKNQRPPLKFRLRSHDELPSKLIFIRIHKVSRFLRKDVILKGPSFRGMCVRPAGLIYRVYLSDSLNVRRECLKTFCGFLITSTASLDPIPPPGPGHLIKEI